MSTTKTVAVRLNGRDRNIDIGHTVLTLLAELDLQPGMVVVELNREILERERYADIEVNDGDSFELVHFVGGG